MGIQGVFSSEFTRASRPGYDSGIAEGTIDRKYLVPARELLPSKDSTMTSSWDVVQTCRYNGALVAVKTLARTRQFGTRTDKVVAKHGAFPLPFSRFSLIFSRKPAADMQALWYWAVQERTRSRLHSRSNRARTSCKCTACAWMPWMVAHESSWSCAATARCIVTFRGCHGTR